MEVFRDKKGNYHRVVKWETCPCGHRYIRESKAWIDTNIFSEKEFSDCCFCTAEKKRKERLKKAEIPVRYWDKTVQSFDLSLIEALEDTSESSSSLDSDAFFNPEEIREKAGEVKDVCLSYIENLVTNIHDGKSLIFTGGPGTGKTHLACSIAVEAAQKGIPTLYSLVAKYFQIVEDVRTKKYRGTLEEDKALQFYSECDLLVLDKVDKGMSVSERRSLRSLLDTRYNNRKATFLLTSLPFQELKVVLGPECIDSFRESAAPLLTFIWASNRKKIPFSIPVSASEKPKTEKYLMTQFFPENAEHPSHKEADDPQKLTWEK